MLDRLPIELLIRALRLALPPLEDSDSYRNRCQFLRGCCLISQRFYGVAQPILLEVFELKTELQMSWIEMPANGIRTQKIRVLVIRGNEASKEWHRRLDFVKIAKRCRGIQEICLLGSGAFDLSPFSRLRNLRRIVVKGAAFPSLKLLPVCSTFPSLVELSIERTEFPTDFFISFPSSVNTPKLRALGIRSSDGADLDKLFLLAASTPPLDVGEIGSQARPSPSLLENERISVSVLEYGVDDVGSRDNFLARLNSLRNPSTAVPVRLSRNIRIILRDTHSLDNAYSRTRIVASLSSFLSSFLSSLTAFDPHTDCPLRILGIPLLLRTASETHVDLREMLQQLLDHCAVSDVKVVWESSDEEWTDSVVSSAVWLIARRRRERE